MRETADAHARPVSGLFWSSQKLNAVTKKGSSSSQRNLGQWANWLMTNPTRCNYKRRRKDKAKITTDGVRND